MRRIPKCPSCGRAPRYAVPSKKRFLKDSEGNVVMENGEPVTEMAFSCRGCAEVFYDAQTGTKDQIPEQAKKLIRDVMELRRKRAEEEKK